ncbi:hypothetical protein DRZ78_00030 [Candidatus Aerophobetes bacterium]|uniref:C2H2-type domain-containing protein n=1 Tax=Aerophobetes bacterium TaxID=2030807 RepID=A0A662D3L7_UNCAE|nr:MAG: hypothetical protein DRZ78_00030 [Candidatus Aerophobetes bacterium]
MVNYASITNIPADIQMTEVLLGSMREGKGWRCPKCNFYTESREEIVQHVQEHINDFFKGGLKEW